MKFKHEFTIGEGYTTYEITEIFKNNRYMGMRYSETTKTLVLVIDHVKSMYEDRWEKDILHYTGMGKVGDQSLDFRINKRLYKSKEEETEVYVFEVFTKNDKKNYIFVGQVELCDKPYQEKQYDQNNQLRNVWIFPLKLINYKSNQVILDKEKLDEIKKTNKKKIKKLSNSEIKNRAKNARKKSGKRKISVNYYNRDVYVSEYTKIRSKGICDLCDKEAPFKTKENKPYLETHHIEMLSKGGADTLENTVALCPNCHKKMHIVQVEKDIKKLKEKVKNYLLQDKE